MIQDRGRRAITAMAKHRNLPGAPVLGSLAALALLAGCGSSGAGGGDGGDAVASGPVKVRIADYKYAPERVTVKAGARIAFTNTDSSPHTATAKGAGSFDTGTLKQGQSKSVTVSKPGSYSYICSFHPFMNGTIVVK